MYFLKQLFNRSADTDRRTLNMRSKTLSLESLEQRIALDASGVRPQLEPVREVHIDNSLAGPDPMVFGKSQLVGHGTKSFVITAVAAGSTVEKWDAAANQWRDVSTPPTSSNPRQLLQLLQNRIIQKDDQVRWIPKSTDGVTQKVFEIIGWDDGSETTTPDGLNMPGPVENLAIDIVGDEVQVTWDPPTSGAAVTHYRIHQNPTTILPATRTSHTFATSDVFGSDLSEPKSFSIAVQANSASGAGETTSSYYSIGNYLRIDGGNWVNPKVENAIINDVSTGKPHHFPTEIGPVFPPGVKHPGIDLSGADMSSADLRFSDLSNANMSDTWLVESNLRFTTLTGANLDGANLDLANLHWVKSGGITGTPETLPVDYRE